MPAAPSPRRPWVAVVLSLVSNGLGHFYAGAARAGLAVYGIWLLMAVAVAVGLRLGVGFAATAGLLAVAFWVVQATLAGRAARRAGEAPRRWFSRPLGLVLLLLASFVPAMLLRLAVGRLVAVTYATPTVSMIPTLQLGDWFVMGSGLSAELGAVVVLQSPRPGGEPLVKRVVAMGGDTVEVRAGHVVLNGQPAMRRGLDGPCRYANQRPGQAWTEAACLAFEESVGGRTYRTTCTPGMPCGDVPALTVPPGQVFVLGDYRDHSADSRVFGPLPESSVLGRALYVYFSFGPAGVRWDRIGAAVR